MEVILDGQQQQPSTGFHAIFMMMRTESKKNVCAIVVCVFARMRCDTMDGWMARDVRKRERRELFIDNFFSLQKMMKFFSCSCFNEKNSWVMMMTSGNVSSPGIFL
jgi:hypothetical protein